MRKTYEGTEGINGSKFVDWLRDKVYKVKNDAHLCRVLDLEPAYLSKVRNNKLPVSAALLLKVHEDTDMPTKIIREAVMGSGT